MLPPGNMGRSAKSVARVACGRPFESLRRAAQTSMKGGQEEVRRRQELEGDEAVGGRREVDQRDRRVERRVQRVGHAQAPPQSGNERKGAEHDRDSDGGDHGTDRTGVSAEAERRERLPADESGKRRDEC